METEVEIVLRIHSPIARAKAASDKNMNACGECFKQASFHDLWSTHKSLMSQEKEKKEVAVTYKKK